MNKIRIGFIGSGGIAHYHASHLRELENVLIAAIADPNPESRHSFIQTQDVEALEFDDFEEMLNHSELDGVIICSPHTLHYQHAKTALLKGCHVLLEKPMVCSVEEAEELIALSKEKKCVLQISYQRHYQPEFIHIKKLIEENQIGILTSVNASLYQDWIYLSAGTWRQKPALSGGGMLFDSGSHILDAILWITGLTPIESKSFIHQRGTEVDIDSFTTVKYTQNVMGTITIAGMSPCWHETYSFIGDKGAIFYENGQVSLVRNGEAPVNQSIEVADNNTDKSFIDAILGIKEVEVPGEFAIRVLKFTKEIYEADSANLQKKS
ncbi:Gfo/Idh/MocA family protein [Metabacillus idriensis]|uniref:Gfo/Idh/MocA family protein n=2 Tax=Bacillaceae TaxID=186817 RepID=UPI001749D383|nr:Gfo/Idh/MocA family oxidoreductase [Metabacillus idriensis]